MGDVNLKQELEMIDYLGPFVVWCLFFLFIAVSSLTCLNWCCVGKNDDITILEEWGYKHNIQQRLGPHRRSVIARNVRKPITKALPTEL